MTEHKRTHRWRGVISIALLGGSIAILAERPSLLLVAIIGVVYSAFPQITSPPTIDLQIERRFSEESPGEEDPVEVTVTVENTGSDILADLRFIDGVPPMLTVIDGTPRHAAVLRPGKKTEFSYTLKARHGVHQFDPATVIARDFSGANEVQTEVTTDQEIECVDHVPAVPIRKQTQRQSFGQIVTDQGGTGIEFHQTREYRHGDPMSRIDWKRYARSGKLTTIEFREERSASLVLCLDCRKEAYRAIDEGVPHAIAYELAAAERLVSALLDERVQVGLAAVGREFVWLPAKIGDDQYVNAKSLLSSHRTFSVYPPNGSDPSDSTAQRQIEELQKHLGQDNQVALISPLVTGFMANMAVELESRGNSVTVISPDVTTEASTGGRLVRIERENRMRSLRNSDIPVIDWDTNTPLGTVLMEANEQWYK